MANTRQRSDGDDPAEAALRAWVAAGDLSPEGLASVRGAVIGYIRANFGRVSEADAEDVAAEAILRFYRAVQRGTVDRERPAMPYLLVTAKNLTVSAFRRQRTALAEQSGDIPQVDDDAISRFIDASADAARVRRALRLAADKDDLQAIRVVGTWLDLAGETGEPPSNRQVATAAKVSHPTVAAALQRFRAYLQDSG